MPQHDREVKPPTGPKNMKEWYLLSYNQVSFFGWAWMFYLAASYILNNDGETKGVSDLVWDTLTYVQTFALLEVVHSLIGIVKAPITTTAMQVASRLFLVWGVNYFIPEIHSHWSFATMVLAWSLADAVRYAYFMFKLSSGVPAFITWARYNFFFVLYPLGVFSEMTIVYQALPYAKAISPLYYYGLILVALIYIPGFPVLFSHMLKQRGKYMRGDIKQD